MQTDQPALSPIERTSLFTLECRTFFYRKVLGTPDEPAEKLLHSLGGHWRNLANPLGLYNSIHLGQRFHQTEKWIRQELEKTPDLQIINLGCGVESFYHHLPAGKWSALNLDFAEVIDFRKTKGIDPAAVDNLAVSLLDPEWLANVNRHRPVLIVLTGVAPYLPTRDLEKLLAMIGGYFPTGSIIIDGPSRLGRFFTNLSIRLTGWTVEPFHSSLFSPKKLADILPKARVVAEANLSRSPGKVPHSRIGFNVLAFGARAVRLGLLRHVRWGNA